MTQRTPRGIRLHNCGNIRHGRSEWKGMADEQDDKEFVRFVSPEYGVRAVVRILRSYYDRYGLKSIRAMINRYAPPVENNTAAYVASVASRLGVDPDDPVDIDDANTLVEIVKGIIRVENGRGPLPDGGWYEDDVILKGIELA